MDKMIEQMAQDMSITRYKSENDYEFYIRIIYSALGLWGLSYAARKVENQFGISKITFTKKLNELAKAYISTFPSINRYFNIEVSEVSIGLYIRQIYEELGYLLYNQQKLIIAPYGRGLRLTDGQYLFFGLPKNIKFVSGLGIVSEDSSFADNIANILIRDDLHPIAYVRKSFDLIQFDEWNKSSEGISYFNPLSKNNISNSWKDYPTTEFTVVKDNMNNFYKVVCYDKKIRYYSNDKTSVTTEGLFGCDYRRLYYSLKNYYDNAFNVIVREVNERYIRLDLYGRLPNREQHFLSLIGWPVQNFNNKNGYIIRKEFFDIIKNSLYKIGVTTKEV